MDNLPHYKACNRCHQTKPATEFQYSTIPKPRLKGPCHECRRQFQHERHARLHPKPPRKGSDTEKYCPKCDRVLDLERFSSSKKYTDGKAWCCKECASAYSRACYLRNKPAILARTAEYQRTHREKGRIYNRRAYAKNPGYFKKWQQDNPEKRRVISRRWYERHPDKVAAGKKRFAERRPTYFQEHYQANKEAYRRRERTRADRIRIVTIERIDYAAIYGRDKGVCQICREPIGDRRPSFDHTIPISKGGMHSMANITLAHLDCNRRKGSKIIQV